MLPEQEMYFIFRKHKKRLIDAIIWWATRKNKHCKSFCPTCKFFFRCQEDIEDGRTGWRYF